MAYFRLTTLYGLAGLFDSSQATGEVGNAVRREGNVAAVGAADVDRGTASSTLENWFGRVGPQERRLFPRAVCLFWARPPDQSSSLPTAAFYRWQGTLCRRVARLVGPDRVSRPLRVFFCTGVAPVGPRARRRNAASAFHGQERQTIGRGAGPRICWFGKNRKKDETRLADAVGMYVMEGGPGNPGVGSARRRFSSRGFAVRWSVPCPGRRVLPGEAAC